MYAWISGSTLFASFMLGLLLNGCEPGSVAVKTHTPGQPVPRGTPGINGHPGGAYPNPAPGQPQYGQPAPGQPQYQQPAPGQPQYGQPAPGQPQYGQPAPGQPQYGQPAPQYGQPAPGQPQYAPPYGGQNNAPTQPYQPGNAQPGYQPYPPAQPATPDSNYHVTTHRMPAGAAAYNGPRIRIGTFNIQVFGLTKSQKPEVLKVLADVVRKFDVLAIQEIRTKDERVIPAFLAWVNSTGRKYNYIIGPRVGRTISQEQYLYVYDTETISLTPDSSYSMSDPADRLHRAPLVTHFRAISQTNQPGFSFSLVNIHTDPDETRTELDAMGDVFMALMNSGGQEDDIIVLGDLNVAPNKGGRLATIPGITWVIHDQMTNTRRTKLYDNIVFEGNRTNEYTGRKGVLDLESEYQLTREQALEVSDHLPVWAEFSAVEFAQPRVAAVPQIIR